jgi:translation initiation factor 2 alpha subunit (eIF-2alpha)
MLFFCLALRSKIFDHLKKVLSVGKVLVLRVVGADNVRGYINLYNKNIKPEEVDKYNLRYIKSKQVKA